MEFYAQAHEKSSPIDKQNHFWENAWENRKRSWPISRVLSWTVIPLGILLPAHSSNLPAGDASNVNASLFGLAADGGYRVSP
jgi:hypothetical protein